MARAQLRRLERRLIDLPARVQRRVARAAVEATAEHFAAEIRNRVPVDTGELRSDVQVQAGDSRSDSVRHAVLVGENADHAGHVEYGTRHAPAQPFMRPALDVDGDRLRGALEKRIARGLEREARR